LSGRSGTTDVRDAHRADLAAKAGPRYEGVDFAVKVSFVRIHAAQSERGAHATRLRREKLRAAAAVDERTGRFRPLARETASDRALSCFVDKCEHVDNL